jgi:hypothetical protein
MSVCLSVCLSLSFSFSTPFLDILRLRSSLSKREVRETKFHTHIKANKIIVLCVVIFIYLPFESKLDDRGLWTEWQEAFPDFKLLLIS